MYVNKPAVRPGIQMRKIQLKENCFPSETNNEITRRGKALSFGSVRYGSALFGSVQGINRNRKQ